MSPTRPSRRLPSALALGFGLVAPAICLAQATSPSGANISTGSGAGTTPGVSPGSSPSSTRTGAGDLRSPSTPQPGTQTAPPRGEIRPQPGTADLPPGLPMGGSGSGVANLSQDELDAIDNQLLASVRAITRPADRAQAMERVARAKIFSHVPGDDRLADAHSAILEGGQAAIQVEDIVTRDIRLTNLVRAGLSLADEQTRDAMTDASDPSAAEGGKPWTARRRLDWLLLAEKERQYAATLAEKIDSTTLRSEMLFRVVDSASLGSQTLGQNAMLADGKRADLKGTESMLDRMADRSLVFAANDAARIAKPIWRDRAMVSIAAAAAASEQFERGIAISRTVPQPQYRADALIRLAEAQARRNLTADATRTYMEAAAAVASIRLDDPRATQASVLIDSLISTGRFDDARACVGLYPDDVRRLEALGTIAENQGERRLAESALAWIERDAPPEIRDRLKIRVNDGILRAFEKGRSNPNAVGGGMSR